jgi:hypothetical protein
MNIEPQGGERGIGIADCATAVIVKTRKNATVNEMLVGKIIAATFILRSVSVTTAFPPSGSGMMPKSGIT